MSRIVLATLKQERDALDAEIKAVERGIERAAYDASMADQLVTVNESRDRDGKPRLTMSQFLSGGEGEEDANGD